MIDIEVLRARYGSPIGKPCRWCEGRLDGAGHCPGCGEQGEPGDPAVLALCDEVERLRALVTKPCAATPVDAQDAPAGERQGAPEPPRDPRHITAESERVPTHEEIDAYADPVLAVERVTGMKWEESPYAWMLRRGPGLQPYAMIDAPRGNGWEVQIWYSIKVGTWPDLTHPCVGSISAALHFVSITLLHALLDGKAALPDGAPGWGAWEMI